MLKYIIIIFVSIYNPAFSVDEEKSRKEHTKGEVWPRLQEQKKEDHYFVYPGNDIPIIVDEYSCILLKNAVHRFKSKMKTLYKYADPNENKKSYLNWGMLKSIVITLTKSCKLVPGLNMFESYKIHVADSVTVISESIWGIMRGLDTLVQLFYLEDKMLVINGNHITDFPKYAHRGLMIDTSFHYINTKDILMILDAMAMNKFNVFHWRIVGDDSFPFESGLFPELSVKGAFHPEAVYNSTGIRYIINFAKNLGIRVIPEFSIVGHPRALERSHPELVATCYNGRIIDGRGPMIPLGEPSRNFMQHFFLEVQKLFPDEFLHLGGDNINVSCWTSNPIIQKYRILEKEFIPDEALLTNFFNKLVQELLINRNNIKKRIILWQDSLETDTSKPLRQDLFSIQLYKKPFPYNLKYYKNIKIIYSEPWDLTSTSNDFNKIYAAGGQLKGQKNVLGGEALLWSKNVDDSNLFSSIWPKACAVAEALWNPKKVKSYAKIPKGVYKRIEEHVCRLNKLMISTEVLHAPQKRNEVYDN